MDRQCFLEQLAGRIISLPGARPQRVAIDGVDAAGKTSLADALAAPLQALGRPVIRASVDGFHLPRQVRYRRGPLSAEGYYLDSFDYPALKASLLDPLGPGGDGRYRTAAFDFRQDAAVDAPWQQAVPNAVLVLDGVFLLRPELEGCWDLAIFLEVPFEVTLARALQRDLDLLRDEATIRQRYTQRYIPAQRYYLETCRPSERADLVVDYRDPFNPQIVRGL